MRFTNSGKLVSPNGKPANLAGWLPPMPVSALGDPAFLSTYQVKAAYYAGGMANAIASEEMVIALGKEGLMGSLGSGGLSPDRLTQAVETIQAAIPDGPYMFNLLHNPFEPEMEQRTVDIFLEQAVRTVEAAAYLQLTPALVQYRANRIVTWQFPAEVDIANHVIAKLSRREIALLFLNPAPEKILIDLIKAGKITQQQAELAARVPMADDITVEADSGGHTDNQPLVSLLPSIIALRDHTQKENRFDTAGAHRRGRRHQHARIRAGSFHDGRGLCGHRIGQPGLRRIRRLRAHAKDSGRSGYGGCEHGALSGYVRAGRARAGA